MMGEGSAVDTVCIPQTPTHTEATPRRMLDSSFQHELEAVRVAISRIGPTGDVPRPPEVPPMRPQGDVSVLPEVTPRVTSRPQAGESVNEYTKKVWANLETYVKDIHWVVEKTMLISEKSMATIDDIYSNQKSLVIEGHPQSTSKASRESTMDRIRGNVFQAAQSIEARFTIPGRDLLGRENSDVDVQRYGVKDASHKEHSPKRTLEEHFQAIYAQQESHSEVLESIYKKIDQISTLAPSQRCDPGPGSEGNPGRRGIPSVISFSPSMNMNEQSSTRHSEGGTEDFPTHIDLATSRGEAFVTTEEALRSEESLADPETGNVDEGPIETLSADAFDVDEDGRHKSCLERMVEGSKFEIIFAVLIVLNAANMCVEAEYVGWGTGHTLGHPGGVAPNPDVDFVFEMIGLAFGIVFTVEVVLKMAALRCKFWKSGWNLFDFFIITIAWFETAFPNMKLPVNPMLLRLLRLIRLVRLARGLAALQAFENLFMMVKGIKAGAPVLMWVVVLIFPMTACCAVGMNYTVIDFILDESKPLKNRLLLYQYFGTFTKALLSIFEVTFASFAPICRFLHEHVDEKYAIFFMIYRLVMGIAVLRVIYGVFLHVTFACAATDDDAIMGNKKREFDRQEKKIQAFFRKHDTSGDGLLCREEFLRVVRDPSVKAWLAGALDLEINDPAFLYDFIISAGRRDISASEDEAGIDADSMVAGIERLRGAASSVDILALARLVDEAMQKLDKLLASPCASVRNGHFVRSHSSQLSLDPADPDRPGLRRSLMGAKGAQIRGERNEKL